MDEKDKIRVDYVSKYEQTVEKIMEKKRRVIIFDGLAALLSNCEMMMRIDHELEMTDVVKFRYWISRNQFFIALIDLAKMHADYIICTAQPSFLLDEDSSKLVEGINAASELTLRTGTKDYSKDDVVGTLYVAKILKSKYHSSHYTQNSNSP